MKMEQLPITFFLHLFLNKRPGRKKIHKKLETKVLQQADVITTVSNSLKLELEKTSNNVKVVTNGFDDEVLAVNEVQLDKKFSISYIGLLPKQSHSDLFFKVLKSLIDTTDNFKEDLNVNFVGDIANEVKVAVNKYQLEDYVNFKGYVQHQEAIQIQQKSQVLLLLIPNVKYNKGILTGKLFEYITTKRPILAIAPKQGDLEEVLSKTNSGTVIEYTNEKKLTEEILRLYDLFRSKTLHTQPKNILQFHRKVLTRQMAENLKQLIT